MDFMSDSLCDGRLLRTFNVLDDYNREGLGIEVDLSLPSSCVIRSLERIIEWRGKQAALRMDNGLLASTFFKQQANERLRIIEAHKLMIQGQSTVLPF
jgi:transposase InsO family protein